MRITAYSNSPTIEQQDVESEPSFFRAERQLLQSTELFIPIDTDLRFSDTQMALFMLATIYGLSLSGLAAIPASIKEATNSSLVAVSLSVDDETENQAALSNKNDQSCMVVSRYENFGGGWGYSVHCVEAIQFKVILFLKNTKSFFR